MTGYSYIIGAGVVAAIGYCLWKMIKNRQNFLDSVSEDVVEGTLHKEDIINYFKSQQIVKGEDIPFLAQSAYDDACRPGNPKETSVADITRLYESLL